MTTGDVDSVDQHSEFSEDGGGSKHTRKDKLKDVFSRTRTKINHIREERVAKKNTKDSAKASRTSTDVDDFLSTGRPSFASSTRPSLASQSRPSFDDWSAQDPSSTISPRPSTSDSRSQASPRRGPPISVPRIDVSTSTRFPNAKDVNPDALIFADSSPRHGTLQSSVLLRPEYKSRNHSTSSIASKPGRARLRGLSVGFANEPPVIIGEGGDEAQAPPVEIGFAKQARARSASPLGRKPYSNANMPPEARRQMPSRGISDISADTFVPKQLKRIQTGALQDAPVLRPARGPHDDELIPGMSDQPQARFYAGNNAPSAQRGPGLPARPNRSPAGRGPGQASSGGRPSLPSEFERTLGMGYSNVLGQRTGQSQEPTIVAPKPQRAPPSYDLIEGGRADKFDFEPQSAIELQSQQSSGNDSSGAAQDQARKPSDPVQRRPVPAPQSFTQQQPQPQQPQLPEPVQPDPDTQLRRFTSNEPKSKQQVQKPFALVARTSQSPASSQQSPVQSQKSREASIEASSSPSQVSASTHPLMPPPQSSHDYYPPPPSRQPTNVKRKIQGLRPIYPRADQNTGLGRIGDIAAPKPASSVRLVENDDDEYRTFADRQKVAPTDLHKIESEDSTIELSSAEAGAVRYFNSPQLHESPAESPPSKGTPTEYVAQIGTPILDGEAAQTKKRFYETVKDSRAPEGFI